MGGKKNAQLMTQGKVSRSHYLERTRKTYIYFWLIN